MTRDNGRFLLSFEELRLRLQFEGCPAEVARSIASQWLCAVSPATSECRVFRVRFRIDTRLRLRPSSSPRPARQVRLRVQTSDSVSRLRLPGSRALLSAGGSTAEIDVHPEILHDPLRMEQAAGAALGQALALKGASFLHGAAVIAAGLPILLVGGPNAGKSTVSAATLAAGGSVVSDDSLILYRDQTQELAIRALRRDLLLREGSLQVLPEFIRQKLQQTGPKTDSRWVLSRTEGDPAFRSSMTPAVICVLRRDRRLTGFRIQPLTQAMAMAALLEANSSPHLLHPQFLDEQQALLMLWTEAATQLPAFELRLGSALLSSPEDMLRDVTERLRE